MHFYETTVSSFFVFDSPFILFIQLRDSYSHYGWAVNDVSSRPYKDRSTHLTTSFGGKFEFSENKHLPVTVDFSEIVLGRFAEKEARKQNGHEVGNSLLDSDVSSESPL